MPDLRCSTEDLWFSSRHAESFSCDMWTLSWNMWDLVPWPGIKFWAPELGTWSLSHWATKEVPSTASSQVDFLIIWVFAWRNRFTNILFKLQHLELFMMSLIRSDYLIRRFIFHLWNTLLLLLVWKVKVKIAQSRMALRNHMGYTVHRSIQGRILSG